MGLDEIRWNFIYPKLGIYTVPPIFFFFLLLLSSTCHKQIKLNKKTNKQEIPSIPALSPIIRSVPAMRLARAAHIYISIQGGLAVLN